MAYRVELTRPAQRDLRRLPYEATRRLTAHIRALAENPRPHGVRKLSGQAHAYRIRVGRFRIIYDIYDQESLLSVLKVDRRREDTYRR